MTRNSEIENPPIWVLPNIWRLGWVSNTKFDTNFFNIELLKAVKCHGYSFYHFWVIKGKPTMVKLPPTQIRVKKASDIFDISPKLLKASSDKIIEPRTFLINGTIKKVVIPRKLKMTIFYPNHNKESKIKVPNYRHISILPLVSKIYKKLIHEHLME